MEIGLDSHRGFMRLRITNHRRFYSIGVAMLDLLSIVLGAGGIMLMVAYAALCERI